MKFFLLLPLFAALSFSSTAQAQKAPAKQAATSPAASGVATAKFKTSAVCEMCKTRIEKSLAYEKGVQSAILDVPSQMLTVTYRADKTTPDVLSTAVQKIGYDADQKPADARAYNRLPECCKKTNAVH